MNLLIILDDGPYGSERTYNGLRVAASLARKDGARVRLFLIGDAAACAMAGQRVPAGYSNAETMIAAAVRHGAEVGVCGTCMDARGITGTRMVPGAHRGTMDDLTVWTLAADRVVTF